MIVHGNACRFLGTWSRIKILATILAPLYSFAIGYNCTGLYASDNYKQWLYTMRFFVPHWQLMNTVWLHGSTLNFMNCPSMYLIPIMERISHVYLSIYDYSRAGNYTCTCNSISRLPWIIRDVSSAISCIAIHAPRNLFTVWHIHDMYAFKQIIYMYTYNYVHVDLRLYIYTL